MARWLAACLLVAASVAALPVRYHGVARAEPLATEGGLEVGQHPPSFSAEDLRGRRYTLRDLEGRVVVLHFWATWCPICRGEVPKLTRIHEQFADRGVLILAVSVDENLTALGEFVKTAALPYPVIADQAPFPIATQYRVQGIPTTYILAPDGRTALRFFGGADLVRAVEHVLALSPALTRS